MGKLKFGTGTWIYGTVGDRYLLGGYRQGLDIFERIKLISGIEGVSGIEVIYPADFGPGIDEVGEVINRAGLDCAIVGVDLTGDPGFKFGTYSSKDPAIREEAVNLTRQTIDVALALGADRINIWPGEDGHDYPFQVDYLESWENFRDCLVNIAEYRAGVKVCIEYKLREPRVRSLISTVGKALLMCQETGRDDVGVTIDVGHSLQAGENMSESVVMLAHSGRLFHFHLNDNYRGWDDDMVVGSVHLVEFLELMYTLRKVGFDDWMSVDVYPYREDPAKVVEESVEFVKGLDALLDRIGTEAIDRALAGDDPVAVLSMIREEILPT
ncbi:MAG: sugar phosphate isomerase/epimerase [Actinobacteria bacterium]|nr:sugar phosphate isomerase/epimerase [Actinomycetota bacterium]